MTRNATSSPPSNGQSGFYVYTPLELADGRLLFVNRGFVPYDLKEPATRPAEPA
jgi:surfeit locus 1 family protein